MRAILLYRTGLSPPRRCLPSYSCVLLNSVLTASARFAIFVSSGFCALLVSSALCALLVSSALCALFVSSVIFALSVSSAMFAPLVSSARSHFLFRVGWGASCTSHLPHVLYIYGNVFVIKHHFVETQGFLLEFSFTTALQVSWSLGEYLEHLGGLHSGSGNF